ncbi:MAG: acyl-CoA dehydrogenase, partial [Marinilabiliales bacterium]
ELIKRGLKGEIDLLTPAKEVGKELMGIPDFGSPTTDYFEAKRKMIVNFKKSILMVAGSAIQKFMQDISNEQELLINAANMIMWTYAAESMLLRIEKLNGMYDEDKMKLYKDMFDVYMFDVAHKINKEGVDAVNSFGTGDEKQGMLMGMKRFTKAASVNVVVARRRIADKLIEDNKYNF